MNIARTCLASMLLVSGIAWGGAPREEKIAELVRLTGMAEMLEESRAASRAQAGQVSDQIFNQMLKEAKALSDEQRTKITAATQRFIETCVSSLDINKAVALYGQLYAAQLSDQELDQIVNYYRSPIGQKDVAAAKAAMPQWQAKLTSEQSAAMQAAIGAFTQDLRQIISESQAGNSGQ
jgi:hypothetical protein